MWKLNTLELNIRNCKAIQQLFVSLQVGLVTMILMRTLRKDYARYSKEDDVDDMERDLGDEYGWKQVHGDVFRPAASPLLFSAMIGSGRDEDGRWIVDPILHERPTSIFYNTMIRIIYNMHQLAILSWFVTKVAAWCQFYSFLSLKYNQRLTPGWGISALLFTLMVPKLLFLSLRAGSQLAVVVLLVILFAILGELYTERGSLLSTSIFMYAATAPVNGYFGGSLYARWISTNIVFSPTSLILYYYLLLIKLQMGQ